MQTYVINEYRRAVATRNNLLADHAGRLFLTMYMWSDVIRK